MEIIVVSAVWCNACLVMKKVLKEIEKEVDNVNFIKYDYDIDEEEVQALNVGEILPVLIFKKGEKEERFIGEKTKEQILNKIEEMVK